VIITVERGVIRLGRVMDPALAGIVPGATPVFSTSCPDAVDERPAAARTSGPQKGL
jgi:hypothetical protein